MPQPKTVATIVGARPQFIKVAPVSNALRPFQHITEHIIHTGQHYDHGMSEIFFSELGIAAPALNLGVGSLSHGAQTGLMLQRLEEVLISMKADLVLIYGDTNSTLAAALAAVKLHIPIAHVEAGLRGHRLEVPEEVNRRVADHMSTALFTPTSLATRNLLAEGISADRVHEVGDVMLDAQLYFSPRAREHSRILNSVGLQDDSYILVTIHRPNHTDDDAVRGRIVAGLTQLRERHEVVWPMHPRTRDRLTRDELTRLASAGVKVIPPVGYLDMLRLELGARAVLTDSGGVQREAYFTKKPCVTLRSDDSVIEWQELVDMGWNVYANPSAPDAIIEAVEAQLAPGALRRDEPVFGDGNAATRIADELVRMLSDDYNRVL